MNMTVPNADPGLAILRDEASIRRVEECYADAITRRDAATYGALYAPDAVWTIGPPADQRIEGRDAIVAYLSGHIATMDFIVFTVSNFVISVDDEIAHSRATVHEYGQITQGSTALSVHVFALYEDKLRRAGDSWLFIDRKYSILHVETAEKAVQQPISTG
jgi:ketosteroid isomerase-like protein